MKILIVSDTHRHDENLEVVLKREHNLDLLIHLGDTGGTEDYIREIAGCPCYIVAGNNDYFSMLDREITIELGNYKVLLTHGHFYYVTLGNENIAQEGIAMGYDIVMFGHTHRPLIDIQDEITLINPGSLSYPRQDGGIPTYIIMKVDDKGEAIFELKYLD